MARIQNKLLGQTLGHLTPDKGGRLLRPTVAPDPLGEIFIRFYSDRRHEFRVSDFAKTLQGGQRVDLRMGVGTLHLSGWG